jgi:hypothetical protein
MTAPGVLASPEIDGRWLRPSTLTRAEPRWGHPDGLQVGLPPLPGPRGLLRVYAPHVDHASPRVLNFVAVEPVPVGSTVRGYSELEASSVDGAAGKLLWTVDPLDGARRPVEEPARGAVEVAAGGVEHLRVLVGVEPFDNGAEVDVLVAFRSDRPHEVSLSAIARAGAQPLANCVLTATMGNYARLRRLQLAGQVVTPAQLWPGFSGPEFTPHARFALDQVARTPGGDALVVATPDETDLDAVAYAPGTAEHWRYAGRRARQTWRVPEPDPELEVWVNARAAYWASASPIPGGPAFENVEVVEPYRAGREYVLGVEPIDTA